MSRGVRYEDDRQNYNLQIREFTTPAHINNINRTDKYSIWLARDARVAVTELPGVKIEIYGEVRSAVIVRIYLTSAEINHCRTAIKTHVNTLL